MNGFEGRTPARGAQEKIAYWRFVCVLFVFIASFVASAAYGQTAPATPPAPEATAQTPSMSVNANEVSLDLVVHDKKHRPVLDLKPEDIEVTDNGALVKLNGFHFVGADAAANTDHMITLVFDPFHGPTAKSARNIAEKILKVLPTKGYSFAVLDFTNRMRLIQGFTQDRRVIEQAVTVATESQAIALTSTLSLGVGILHDEKAEAGKAGAASEAEKDLIAIAQTGADVSGHHVDVKERARAQTLVKALQDTQTIAQEQHTLINLAGLLALVKSQQNIGDRKALIYFTLNGQMDAAAKEMLKTITGAATRAGVSIYTVDLDALGNSTQYQVQNALLNGQPPYDPQPVSDSAYTKVIPMQQQAGQPIAGTPSMQGAVWGPKQTLAMATDFMRGNNEDRTNPFADTKSPMAGLAKDTGGAYIDAQNNTKKPLEQMVQDLTSYYQASYIPPFQEYDGAFRTIAIKPLRQGLDIQSKTGYFALAPGVQNVVRPFEAPLLQILKEEALPSDFKFKAAVLRFGELPDGNTNTLMVEVPLSELETHQDVQTKLYAAHASIVAQIKDKDGTVIEHFGEDIVRRGALESLDRDKAETITLQRHFIDIPGQYVMEVAVQDQNSGKKSVQRVHFEIPAVVAGPSLSDMVLVRKMDSFQEDADPLEPLRYEHSKATPNLSGEVSGDAKNVSLFFILHRDPQAKDPATLEMIVSRNGKPGKRTPLPLHAGSTGATMPYLATFQTKSLLPGLYDVKAMLSQGGKTAVQEVSFTVAGTQAAAAEPADATKQGSAPSPAYATAQSSELTPTAVGQLAITVPTNPVPPPTPEEIRQLIADARERAQHYADSLPNFMCIQVTSRSVDAAGRGRWKLRDTITELLRYRDKSETRTMLKLNGKPSNTDRDAMRGTFSSGEFGGVLKAIFQDSAKADFVWKETDALGGGTVQVFDYRVASANSIFAVTGLNDMQIAVAFHGRVYIDTATRSVRRVTLVADDMPRDFPTHSTSIQVDYDYVVINAHDYLIPISAEVSLKQGRHEAVLNTIEFHNYRRFGSNVKILDFSPLEKP
jgi:VWFA-related protein